MNFQGLEFDGVPADGEILSDNESVSSLVDEDVEDGYVYALFHFPQMVDGQITVEEGEKLTLLDDSNSYWWLVQSLRDNRMGYIPADNIETSEGKKARVYRRRNLKLCQPDPEMVRKAESTPLPRSHGRRVNFSDKLVTEVFISSPATDDEDEDEDDGYDYDYGDEDTAGAAGDAEASDKSRGGDERTAVADPRLSLAAAGGDAAVPEDDSNDNDSDGYSYYYSTAAGDAESSNDRAGSPASDRAGVLHAANGRRVSIAPIAMGQIDGEVHGDLDSESETDSAAAAHRRQGTGSGITGLHTERGESAVAAQPGEDAPAYYLSNDESDDGDSLTGVLGRLNGSRESPESGRFTVEVVHVDSYSRDSASVSVFEDELFSEVLRRALAVFGMSPRMKPTLTLYAKLGSGDLAALPGDMQTVQLIDSLRAAASKEALPASGNIGPHQCTLVLADKSIPVAQLAARLGPADEDPYATMDTGSRNILRTSVAASISEGITSLAASAAGQPANGSMDGESSGDEGNYDLHSGSAADSDLVPAGQRSSLAPDSDGEDEALPDSRKVVQGLLRSIPPPKSQPPQSAIDRAKRNTMQLMAHASATDVSSREPRDGSPTLSGLSRPASARSLGPPVDTAVRSAGGGDRARALGSVSLPSEPTVGFHGPIQALGHSASTLRPSSDTFIHGDSGSDSAEDPQDNTAVDNAYDNGVYAEEPASPTESSHTASTHNEGSEDAVVPAAGTLTALSHSAPHRLLKDGGSDGLAHDLDNGGGMSPPPGPGELSLDDWLVLLHGWSSMHDASTNAGSFYESFLKDMESTVGAGDALQLDASSLIQRQMAELTSTGSATQSAIEDILGVSQGVGRRLDTLERELDNIARLLVQTS
ncbi:hypothetical protein H4R21_000796 [Coemansia helicoidea]|uniref:Uncharacterized protein n=1 Tax=Coemansia helicoidea TaxID=1286919 RepID=A0ACC1LEJ6_9FUNG|nr:hypothetical protein H4R21_000796 [Coemansia helicoidea]